MIKYRNKEIKPFPKGTLKEYEGGNECELLCPLILPVESD